LNYRYASTVGTIRLMLTGRRLRLALALAVATTLASAFMGSAMAAPNVPRLLPGPADALTTALDRGELTPAVYALWRARSLFDLRAVRARFGSVTREDPRAATLVLRDLIARYRMLGPSGRAMAEQILARPDEGFADPQGDGYSVPEHYDCKATFCVHWVATTSDAPAATDTNANGIPDYVETAEQVVQTVWDTEVGELGYRAPKQDLSSPDHGPDGKLDVYLADLGNDGLYGYCTTDDPNAFTASYPYADVSAYCVVDNDFSPSQYGGFGGATGVQALEVTVAHEFFHAVQAAYDFFEDLVLIEGTAVWMEDEVYDDINDNYYYLSFSALKRPEVPFDLAITSPASQYWGFYYGAFVFYRYLSERYSPAIIRRVWEYADGSPSGPDQYSLQAIDSALRQRGSTFRAAFADWTAANAFPKASYEEGAAYPVPPVTSRRTLAARAKQSHGSITLDHLSSRYVKLIPGTHVRRTAHLRVDLRLPRTARGSAATVLTVARSGAITAIRAKLASNGHATVTVPFGHAKIAAVVLVLTNAGNDYTCNRGSPFACAGIPLDDNLTFRYTATVT
jgi:hypothetical protein